MQGVFFLSGLSPSPRGGGGAIRRAYGLGQNHHSLRAWRISQDFAGSKSELFGIMTTTKILPARGVFVVDRRKCLEALPAGLEDLGDVLLCKTTKVY